AAEEAGIGSSPALTFGGEIEGNVFRDSTVPLAKFFCYNRANVREGDPHLGTPAVLHQLCRLAVVADLRIERAHERDAIHDLSHLGQKLADVNAWHRRRNCLEGPAGRSSRLGVKGLQLARSARKPEKEDVFLLLADFRRGETVQRRSKSGKADAQC